MLTPILIIIGTILIVDCQDDPYQQQIRTGIQDLRLAPSTLGQDPSTFSILITPVISGSYDYCLALQQLQINYQTDRKYSYDVEYKGGNNTHLDVDLSSAHPGSIVKAVLRYLLIKDSYNKYLKILHYRHKSPGSSSSHIDRDIPISENRQLNDVPNNAQHYHFLLALDMIPTDYHNLTFSVTSRRSSENHVEVNVETNTYNYISVFLISFDILVYDRQQMKEQMMYEFTASTQNQFQGSIGSNQIYKTYDKDLSAYEVFYGVSGYTFKHGENQTLSFSLSHSGRDLLAVSGQNQFLNVDYFIFHRLQACDFSKDYIWNQTSQYCQCPLQKYQNSQECKPCLDNCMNCTDENTCIDCLPGYTLQTLFPHQCYLDCQTLFHPECTTCDSPSECDDCSDGYYLTPNKDSCINICGDGKLVPGVEECDDQNEDNHDGCSSSCQVESDYFTCTDTALAKSICTLTELIVEAVGMVKEQSGNKVVVSFALTPGYLKGFQELPWIDIFDQNQNGIEVQQVDYTSADGLLRVLVSYDQTANFSALMMGLSPQNLQAPYDALLSRQVNLPSFAKNNLSLAYHSDSVYIMASAVKYLAYMAAFAALIVFFLGNFGAKLAAIQCVSLFQLTALLQLSLQNMSPTFAPLNSLVFCLGATPLVRSSTYYEYTNLPENIKYLQIDRNSLLYINIFCLIVVAPIITGLIIRCVVKKKPEAKILVKAWKNSLGTFTFYQIVFLTYGFMLCLAVNVRYFQLSLDTGIGVCACAVFSLLLMGYLIAMHRQPLNFGSFRNKFQKFNISEYHYTFQILERTSSAFLLVGLGPGYIAPGVVCGIFIILALFVAVKKPYMLGIWKRALFVKIVAIVLCLIYVGVNFMSSDSSLSLYAPFIIITLLLTTLVISVVYSLPDIKQYYLDTKSKIEIPLTTDECHELQRKQLEKKLFQFEGNPFTSYAESMNGVKLMRDRWDWENYPRLYSLDIEKIIQKDGKRVRQEEEEVQEEQYKNDKQEKKSKEEKMKPEDIAKQYNAL